MNAAYNSGIFSSIATDPNLTATNAVIRSLDIEPANNAYAMAEMISPTSEGFTPLFQTVPSSTLESTILANAAKGGVTTALSFDSSGNAYVVSYRWAQDSKSAYDATLVGVSPSTIISAAQSLASEGYVITAFGGDDKNGRFLVGTRLTGTSTTRSVLTGTSNLDSAYSSGYAVVAIMFDSAMSSTTWIYEK